MLKEIKHVQATADLLYSEQQVEAAIDKMAQEINTLLADRNPLLLCVLNGGIVMAGKLLTRLKDSLDHRRHKRQSLSKPDLRRQH